MRRQRTWQRVALLAVLGYEGLGGLLGGSLLVAAPDGRLMDMPVHIMRGVFPDFFVPGVILCCLGALNAVAFAVVLRRSRADWIAASLAIGGFLVWFFVEIVILQELHWLHAMWGLPVVLSVFVAAPLLPFSRAAKRAAWLACGLASSVLYVAMNVLVPLQWPEYDSASQTVSELSAIGAPTRPLWVALAMVYTVLVTAFGWGVRMSAGRDRRLRLAGTLIAAYGALGILWPFAPMHLRETLAAGGGTFSDTMHIAFAVVTQLLYLGALGLAAVSLGRAFRVYSIVTFATLLFFGVLSFRDAPRMDANLPTPLLGVWERIDIGLFLAWIVVLGAVLLVRGARTVRARAAVPHDDEPRGHAPLHGAAAS